MIWSRCLAAACVVLLASTARADLEGPAALQSSAPSDWMRRAWFDLDEGTVSLTLPPDLAPGDTITGSVAVLPSGAAVEVFADPEGPFAGFTVEIGDSVVPLEAGRIVSDLPDDVAGISVRLRDARGRLRGAGVLDVEAPQRAPVPEGELRLPGPYHPSREVLVVRGRFNGDSTDTLVTADDVPWVVLVESPRTITIARRATPAQAGAADLVVSETGRTSRAEIVLLDLHSTSRRDGGRFEVDALVTGLEGPPNTPHPRLAVGIWRDGVEEQSVTVELDPRQAVAGRLAVSTAVTLESTDPFGCSVSIETD